MSVSHFFDQDWENEEYLEELERLDNSYDFNEEPEMKDKYQSVLDAFFLQLYDEFRPQEVHELVDDIEDGNYSLAHRKITV